MATSADSPLITIAVSVLSSTLVVSAFNYLIERRRLTRTSDEVSVIAEELKLAKQLSSTSDGKALSHVLTAHAHQYTANKVVGRDTFTTGLLAISSSLLGVLALAFFASGDQTVMGVVCTVLSLLSMAFLLIFVVQMGGMRAIVVHLAEGTMKEADTAPRKYRNWVKSVRELSPGADVPTASEFFSKLAELAIPPGTRMAIAEIATAVATDCLTVQDTGSTADRDAT